MVVEVKRVIQRTAPGLRTLARLRGVIFEHCIGRVRLLPSRERPVTYGWANASPDRRADVSCTALGLVVALLFVALLGLSGCGNAGETTQQNPSTTNKPVDAPTVALTLKDQTFNLEIALDDASRNQGLSDRKSIDDDGGMLFVFAYPRSTQFVMRRCYVPIDLIFIDENGYIDSLHAMQVIEPIGSARWKNPSSGYRSAGQILYAVELRGGKIQELGLSRGEKVNLPESVLQLKAQ